VVESQWNRGYATAAVAALVTKAREASGVRRIVAHAPPERPKSGRVLEKAGFVMVGEIDDADEDVNVVRVEEWELAVWFRVARRAARFRARLPRLQYSPSQPAATASRTNSPRRAAVAGSNPAPATQRKRPRLGAFRISGLRVSRRGTQSSSPRQPAGHALRLPLRDV